MRQGVSLIELMVGIAILGIILTGVTGILRSSLNSYSYTSQEVFNNQQERNVLYKIAEEIRNATVITSPNSGEVSTFSYKVKVGGSDEAREISWDNSDYSIVLRKPGKPDERLAINRTEALTFTRINANPGEKNKVQIHLILHNDPKNPQNKSPKLDLTETIITLNDIP